MKEYVLNYYPLFKCIAGECKHTCCAGWEMNIDEQSLLAYKNEKSNFSKALKNGINFKKSKFKSDKNKRCAFLNDKGLCEIILNLNEQSLCQVCRDHPRFRSFIFDRTETGLGFCCEQATKIILSFEDKITPILIDDDGKDFTPDFIQNRIIDFRKKALDIIQDRNLMINDRIKSLIELCGAKLYQSDFKKIIKVFLSFERLDKQWTNRLKTIQKKPISTNIEDSFSHYCEQFISNGIYRHLSNAEDVIFARAIILALIISWLLIQHIINQERIANNEDLSIVIDVIRAYSAEVEYSQKNLDKLFNYTLKHVNV